MSIHGLTHHTALLGLVVQRYEIRIMADYDVVTWAGGEFEPIMLKEDHAYDDVEGTMDCYTDYDVMLDIEFRFKHGNEETKSVDDMVSIIIDVLHHSTSSLDAGDIPEYHLCRDDTECPQPPAGSPVLGRGRPAGGS